jgi:hypothetical protein
MRMRFRRGSKSMVATISSPTAGRVLPGRGHMGNDGLGRIDEHRRL